MCGQPQPPPKCESQMAAKEKGAVKRYLARFHREHRNSKSQIAAPTDYSVLISDGAVQVAFQSSPNDFSGGDSQQKTPDINLGERPFFHPHSSIHETMAAQTEDFAHVADHNSSLLHIRQIDSNGNGDVHEVNTK